MILKQTAAVLALCLGFGQGAAAQGFFDNLKGALGGDQKPAQDATYLDRLTASRPGCGGNGQTSYLNASVEQGLGVVAEKEISAYLQGIAAKLLRHSPYPACQVTVYVTPHDAAQAVALADGGILIALGFLRNLKNEDEVAALLAHELSHILMDHHSSDSMVESQDGFLKGLEAANASGGMLLGLVDPNLKKSVDATLSVGDALYNVSESMIAPAWTVAQEDEADLLGTDLLVAAGYNPRAMASVMDIIQAQEANAAAVDAERDRLYQQRVTGSLMDAVTTTNPNDTTSIVGAVAGLTSALVSGADKKTHRPAAERKADVLAYIKQFHSQHRRRAFAAEPWETRMNAGESGQMFAQYRAAASARRAVFTGGDLNAAAEDARKGVAGAFSNDAYPRLAYSEVRLKQGAHDKALENLELAMGAGNAPWHVYRSYADMQLATGNAGKATETVESADRKFGRPLGIAPYAIKVYRSANNSEKVNYYMERCRNGGSRAHIKVCETAAGLEPETGSGQSGGGATGVRGFFGGIISGGAAGSSSSFDPLSTDNPSPD
ncbi:MAG: M48 family metalloprotease [Alphaproteobacteria bacterium]